MKGVTMKKTTIKRTNMPQDMSAQRAREGILSTMEVEKLCVMFRMLADPTRMKIVLGLMKGDMCVGRLMEVCDGTQSAVSHQLRVLRDNKIVKAKRMGQNVEYSIADEHVYKIVEMSVAHLACLEEGIE